MHGGVGAGNAAHVGEPQGSMQRRWLSLLPVPSLSIESLCPSLPAAPGKLASLIL